MEYSKREAGEHLLKQINAQIEERGQRRYKSFEVNEGFLSIADPIPYEHRVSVEYSTDICLEKQDYELLLEMLGEYAIMRGRDPVTNSILERDDYEIQMRKKNPILRKAYEKYQTLLELCRK